MILDTPTAAAGQTATSNIAELFLRQGMRLDQLAEKASGTLLIRTSGTNRETQRDFISARL
jgi:hypothetical protein